MIRLLVGAFVAICCCFGASAAVQAASQHKHVLMITSYHHGDRWNDSVVQGVRDVLGPLGYVDLAIEHLDLRRNMGEEYEAAMTLFLQEKYRRKPQDLIIVSDDAALDFLFNIRSEFFPRVPAVFCGINNFTPDRLKGQGNITGVNEEVSIAETLESALRLFPRTSKIMVLLDEHSAVSRANLEHYRGIADQFKPRVEMVELLNLSALDAPQVLQALPSNSLALRLTTLLEPQGGYMPLEESMRLISESAPVPVFTVWDFDMGQGALGGIVVSGLEQGHKAGELAKQILAGRHADHLPVIMESPNVAMFDYQQMLRFYVREKDLPAGAKVTNRPLSALEEYKYWFWAGATVIILLVGLVTLLLFAMSRRKKAEAALCENAKSMSIFNDLVNSTDSIVVVKDTQLRYLLINDAYTRLTGWTQKDVQGKTDWELFQGLSTPEQIERYVDNDRIALNLSRGDVLTSEEETTGKDGLVKTYLTKKFPIYLGDELLGTGTMTTEITAQKRVQQALREVKDYLGKLIRFANAPIIVWNRELVITEFNKAFERITGLTREEALGRHISILFPEDRKEGSLSLIHQALAGDQWEVVEIPIIHRDGTIRTVLWNSANILQDDGKVVSTIAQGQDITERKKAEAALVTAKEQAEAANKAKSEFLANMSHELRTPLNGIMGLMQLLQTTPLSEEQDQYVSMAVKSSDRLTRLLTDLLDISKIEAGKMEVCAMEFNLNSLVGTVADLFAVTAREKGIELDFHIDAHLPSLLVGDEMRVRQILFNLVGNAMKFTEKGAVRVSMAPLPPGKVGDVRVMFSVSDMGVGIPDEKVGELFQPFVQVDGSYTRRYQGAGLGLAIVRQLVGLMNGNLCVESEVGVGTTMHVVLPFTLSGEAHRPTDQQEAAGQAAKKPGLRILLAEDEPSSSFPTRKLLEQAGHTVTLAEDGRQAVELFKSRDFDCILMDVQMPVMNGVEATKEIRDLELEGSIQKPKAMMGASELRIPDRTPRTSKRIPIIALTAYAMKGDRETFLAAGMDGYLAKPVKIEEVKRVLERAAGECLIAKIQRISETSPR